MNYTKYIVVGILATVLLASCKKERNDYVTLSGKITNQNSSTIFVMQPELGYKKEITLNENGSFKDTLKVKDGFYTFFDGREYAGIYLQNGDEISISLDAKEFDETIKFSGEGAEESNFIASTLLKQEQFLANKTLFELPKNQFTEKVTSFIKDLNSNLSKNDLDQTFVDSKKEEIKGIESYLLKSYENKNYVANTLAKGKPSPEFNNYENYKGGTTSLKDFKGKYVYIDIWATWCEPCKQEIPYLKRLEKFLKGKNIEVVSISVDQDTEHETWKNMIKEKELTGVQLFSKRDTTFLKGYRVTSIPRFILLDPNGNIIEANAPRPSQAELGTLLKNYLN